MPKKKRSKSPIMDMIEDGFDDDLDSNDDKPGTPIQRNAANARERARMRVLSKAFFNLKRNIPWVPVDTKLSKLDTLRLAKNYISYLAATLDGQSVEDFSTNLAQPPKTAWPFVFQPVQPLEATKPKLLSATVSESRNRTEVTPTNQNIKSPNFSPQPPSSVSQTSGGCKADKGSFSATRDESNPTFAETRSMRVLSQTQHHHHHQHQQEHNHLVGHQQLHFQNHNLHIHSHMMDAESDGHLGNYHHQLQNLHLVSTMGSN
ncbi:neurogenic differentiation factor 1 [Uranotaenia lowii]|uniref:neurogenic differentiation factor 1 n=1 Tax=Uranotaenia lowii TaxID=190385 RepID=UPI0024799016|nr:neurogenic differentiation factor 1 [Uranotaenia lowii]